MKVFYYRDVPTKEEIEARKEKSEEAPLRKPTFGEKAKDYLKAEATHALQGPASEEVIKERVALCLACPGRVDELEGLVDQGGVGFCTKCGCPASNRSQLSVKLTLAGIECPLGKFKKVEGSGATLTAAAEAVKGVLGSLGGQLLKAVKKVGG